MSTNVRSLPQNKVMFGLDQIAKFQLHRNTCQLSGHFYQRARVLGCRGGKDKLDAVKNGWKTSF